MASSVIGQRPGAAVGVVECASSRCCDHDDGTEPGQDCAGWVRALAVATFDVGTGHTLEQVFPEDSLDEGDRQRIRMLAMPDCNTTHIGDCFYCFRTRKSHRLPLMSSSLLDQHFEYCYAFFRQERNQECARGMFQKSVVLVSRYPYVDLFERLVKVIGPLYFSHGPAVLEAVFTSMEEWPAPCPGSLCPLSFLSETIMFQVPEIDMPPQVAAKYRCHRGVHLCAFWPRSRVRTLRRSLSGCGSLDFQHSPSGRRASGTLSVASPDHVSRALRRDAAVAARQLVSGSSESLPNGDGNGNDDGDSDDDDSDDDGADDGAEDDVAVIYSAGGDAPVKEGSSRASDRDHAHDSGPSTRRGPLGERPAGEYSGVDAGGAGRSVAVGGLGSADAVKGGAAAGVRRNPVFWSGAARSPGVLVTPGLQAVTEGLDDFQRPTRSALGSGSLASVVCNSPSESWLATPKSGSIPLLTLDGSAGSNLVQSSYYVADRDSGDEEEEKEEMERRRVISEQGWQGIEHDHEYEFENGDEGGGPPEGRGIDVVPEASSPGRGCDSQQGGGEGGPPGASAQEKDAQEDDGKATRALVNARKETALDAAYLAVAEAAAIELQNTGNPGRVVTGAPASSPGEQHTGTVIHRNSRPPLTLELESTRRASAAAEQTAGIEASDVAGRETSSSLKPSDRRTAVSTEMESKQRATSLSPLRSTSTTMTLFERINTSQGQSQTPGPKSKESRFSLERLRAWADAASENPWEAPPPLATDLAAKAKAAAPPSTTRVVGGGDQHPVVVLEELLERRGRRHPGRGRSNEKSSRSSAEKMKNTTAPMVKTPGRDSRAPGIEIGSLGDSTEPESDVGTDTSGGCRSDAIAKAREVVVVAADLAQRAERVAEVKQRSLEKAAGFEEEKARRDGDGGGNGDGALGILTAATANAAVVGGPGVEGAVDEDVDRNGGLGTRVGQDRRSALALDAGGQGRLALGNSAVAGGVRAEEKDEGREADTGGAGRSLSRRPSSSSVRLVQDQRGGYPRLMRINSQEKGTIHRSASNLQGGRSPFAEMLLADEARFRAKQGLFQSIGLYSIFGKKLVEHLWLLWELVITASPTLVVGSSVGASSAAILGMVSLASPVYFGGDFRPHFTAFDPDYRDIVAAHDRVSKQHQWGSSVLGVSAGGSGADSSSRFPSMLLGVINPIFLRTLSRWPNAIVLPGAAGRSCSSGVSAKRKPQRPPSDDDPRSSPRNRNCPTPNQVAEGLAAVRLPPVRVQVVRPTTSLEQVVAVDERPHEPIIVSRQQPVMVPDVSVLSRLLDPASPYNPATAAAAAAEASTPIHGRPPTPIAGVVAAASAAAAAEAAGGEGVSETKGQWRDSLRAINDIILRRHFADLTRSFLAPYDKYFRRSRPPQSLTSWQQRAVIRLSVYTNAEVLLPRFDEEEFLTEMFVAGPPKSFAHVQWETLYRRFMDSPNFRPWFTTQRTEAVDRIRDMSRAVCLRTTPQGMVEACAPTRLPQLLGKIRATIAREWRQREQSVDWELLERMELHQKAVEAAVAKHSSRGKTATGSAQP